MSAPNRFFTFLSSLRVVSGTKVRASQFNGRLDEIEQGFSDVADEVDAIPSAIAASETAAATSATAAATSATAAATSATSAQSAKDTAVAAKDTAVIARNDVVAASEVVSVALPGLRRILSNKITASWTERTHATANSWFGVCWSPELGLFCAVAGGTVGTRVMTSPDGINWTSRTEATGTKTWVSVCWSPALGLFCAVASNSATDSVMTSPDGINWTFRTTPT